MRTTFYYTPGGNGNPMTEVEAIPDHKFLMVGVNFYMTGILKEGKSSIFMTPLANSFSLLKDGAAYSVLNASDIPDMTDYYIHDVGSMYRDRFIDKDDAGSGVLIYVVPLSFSPSGAYVTFCPKNLESWEWSGYYRSPDDWDCGKNPVGPAGGGGCRSDKDPERREYPRRSTYIAGGTRLLRYLSLALLVTGITWGFHHQDQIAATVKPIANAWQLCAVRQSSKQDRAPPRPPCPQVATRFTTRLR